MLSNLQNCNIDWEAHKVVMTKIIIDFERLVTKQQPSTIGERVQRAKVFFDAMTNYSRESRVSVFARRTVDYDAPNHVFGGLVNILNHHFERLHRAFSLTTANSAALLSAAFEECRRVAIETSVTFRYLDLHHQWEGKPINLFETVATAVRGAQKDIAATTTNVARVICESLRTLRREQTAPAKTADSLRAISKSYELLRMLTKPECRDACYNELVALYKKDIRDFYRTAPSKMKSVQEIISQVNGTIEAELQRAKSVFNLPETIADVRVTLQQSLIGNHALKLVRDTNDGGMALMAYPNFRNNELRLLYRTLDFDPAALKILRDALVDSVEAAGRSVSPTDIIAIVTLRAKYAELVSACISAKDALDFHLALQQGLIALVPTDGTFEEALAQLFDRLIRHGHQSHLPGAAEALTILGNHELFISHYKLLLASRLMLKGNANFPLERAALQHMAYRRGAAPLRHIEIMIEDAARGPPYFCNAYAWPQMQGVVTKTPPPDVDTHITQALAAASNEFPQFAWAVDHSLTTVEVELLLPGAAHPCLILGSVAQCAALSYFAGDPSHAAHSAEDVAKALGVPEGEAALVMQTLVRSGFLTQAAGSGCVSLNTALMAEATSRKKMVLPTVGGKKLVDLPRPPSSELSAA